MPKVRKKRMGFVIDMTPLVDITFLLLTFLMFTAKFKSEAESDQKFTIRRPNASADTSKLPEHDLAVIKIAVDDKITTDTSYYFGWSNVRDKDSIRRSFPDIPQQIRDQLKDASLVKVDTVTLGKLILYSRAVNRDVKFALDADKGIPFNFIWKAMDIMNRKNQRIFNYVTEKRKAIEIPSSK